MKSLRFVTKQVQHSLYNSYRKVSRQWPWSVPQRLVSYETIRNPFFGRVPLLRPLTRRNHQHRVGEEANRRLSRTNDEEIANDSGKVAERKRKKEGDRTEEGMEPVFERSGESSGYTFTDLHYPRFAPLLSETLTPTRAHRQPTNCPVTHEPVVHVIAMTHN